MSPALRREHDHRADIAQGADIAQATVRNVPVRGVTARQF
jgi:hypothetical protein